MDNDNKPTLYEIFTQPLFRRAPLITLQGLLFVCAMAFIVAFGWNTRPWA